MKRHAKITAALTILSGLAYSDSSDVEEYIEEVYLAPDAFIREAFNSEMPKSGAVWLSESIKPDIRMILGHDYPAARIRYWRRDQRSVWILEEIGKLKPITTGIIVDAGEIVHLKVLVYRESRGWEVKYPFFTDQFNQARLDKKKRLTKSIDGISGATLSVNALEKLGRLALLLHEASNPVPSAE